MRLIAVLVGAALCVPAYAGPRARPAGKVVRVERRPRGPVGTPRYCPSVSSDIGSAVTAYCIGKAPDIGDRLTVLDTVRPLGSVRITSVTPIDQCQQNTVWMIQGTLENGDLSAPQGQSLGVLDVALEPRGGRIVSVDHSPSGKAGEQVTAIDETGDGTPEIEFVSYACDDAGNQSSAATGSCIDVWTSPGGHGFERLRQDRVRNCF